MLTREDLIEVIKDEFYGVAFDVNIQEFVVYKGDEDTFAERIADFVFSNFELKEEKSENQSSLR